MKKRPICKYRFRFGRLDLINMAQSSSSLPRFLVGKSNWKGKAFNYFSSVLNESKISKADYHAIPLRARQRGKGDNNFLNSGKLCVALVR